jgi:Tfp pilus assembly protein PilV
MSDRDVGARGRATDFRSRLRDSSGLGLIEVITAMVILSIGVLAVAGIAFQVGVQTRLSTWQTDQSLAAQQVMESLQRGGYTSAVSRTDTVTVGTRTYVVTAAVSTPANRVKQVQLTVQSPNGGPGRSYTGRIYQSRQLPSAP